MGRVSQYLLIPLQTFSDRSSTNILLIRCSENETYLESMVIESIDKFYWRLVAERFEEFDLECSIGSYIVSSVRIQQIVDCLNLSINMFLNFDFSAY